MSNNRKQDGSNSVTPLGVLGRPPTQYTVEDVVKLVRFSFLATMTKIGMVDAKST